MNRFIPENLLVSKTGNPIKLLTTIMPIIEPNPNRRMKEIAISTLSRVVAVNAIKLYFEKVLRQTRTYYDLRPKKEQKLQYNYVKIIYVLREV